MIATHSPSKSLNDFSASPKHQRGRPSITSPISWLGRASIASTTSARPSAPTPLKISEPTMIHDVDGFGTVTVRMGPLGQGAVVVGTPQEALARAMVSHSSVLEEEEPVEDYSEPTSPPPVLPPKAETQQAFPPLLSRPVTLRRSKSPSTNAKCRSSSFKSIPSSPSSSRHSHPDTPPLSPTLDESDTAPLPFNPVLLVPFPEDITELSQVIVSLETATETQRTTLATLLARPSHLSRYVQALLPERNDADSSVESPFSPHFSALFRDPATSAALASQRKAHIFLDRPSTSYAHILAFLRMSPTSPPRLPHSIQYQAQGSERLMTLLELRDEAKFLDLDELYRLCCEELRHPPHPVNSDPTTASVHSGDRRESSISRQKRFSVASLTTTAVDSPKLAARVLAEHYVPPPSALRARSRSDSRGDTVPPKAQGGWI